MIEVRYSQGILRDTGIDVLHVADEDLDDLLHFSAAWGFARMISAALLAVSIRTHRIALVRTTWGYREHERRFFARLTDRVLDRVTTRFVALEDAGNCSMVDHRTVVIPHARFVERFRGYPDSELIPDRILWASDDHAQADEIESDLLRARSSISLARAFNTPRTGKNGTTSHILAGESLAVVSDGALVQLIRASEVVVVPDVSTLSHIQTVFIALSLDRPVLAPLSAMTLRLAERTGPGWVFGTNSPITASDVEWARTQARDPDRKPRPQLEGRELTAVRRAYASVFEEAANEAKQGRRRSRR